MRIVTPPWKYRLRDINLLAVGWEFWNTTSAAVLMTVLCHIDRACLRFLTTALKSPVTSVESLIVSVKNKTKQPLKEQSRDQFSYCLNNTVAIRRWGNLEMGLRQSPKEPRWCAGRQEGMADNLK